MNSKFINVLVFAVGAAIGSAVTYKVVKTRYDRLIQEEIESVKEVFADRARNSSEQDECDSDEDVDDSEDAHTTRQINWEELEDLDENDEDDDYRQEYDRLTRRYTSEKGGAEHMSNTPRVIEPYEFGEMDGYSIFELTYYADGILEDEDYNIVRDPDELIGPDALGTFGEYEEDAVFVRNDKLRADFQILRDYDTYDQARSIGPNKVNNE